MNVKFISEEIVENKKAIFLDGPNPYLSGNISWKHYLSEKLGHITLDAEVYFPYFNNNKLNEIDKLWIKRAKNNANVIIFWIPKNIKFTEIEKEEFIKNCFNEKLFFGCEEINESSYELIQIYQKITNNNIFYNLDVMLEEALNSLKEKIKVKCS